MSEHQALGDAGNAEAGRDRRAAQSEGRRPVDSRDRAPEVYVESEQVARLVETRKADDLPDVPQASWFDDDVPPSAAPAMVAVLDRPADEAVAQAAAATDASPPRGMDGESAETSTEDRLIDEFDVVVRGLDDPGSAMNAAFPRLGKQGDTDIFDPLAFEFPRASDAPEGTMRPAVEPPMPGQGKVDLSGDDKAPPDFESSPPTNGFGEPPADSTMRPAVEPRTEDTTVDLSRDEPAELETKPGDPGPRDEAVGTRPPIDLPGDRAAPIADEAPGRLPGLPGVPRDEDSAIPTRPGLEDLAVRGRTGGAEAEPIATKSAPPESGREFSPVARDIDRAPTEESLDVFDTRPAAGLPTRESLPGSPTWEPAANADPRDSTSVPDVAAPKAEVAREVVDDNIPDEPVSPGVRPGSGFFDEAPTETSSREDSADDLPVSVPVSREADSARHEAPLPVDDGRDAPSRLDLPDSAREELAPLKFEDDDNLDDG